MDRVQILDSAARDLAQLDKDVGRRVTRRIHWLAENLDDLNPEALAGDLIGFYKLRVGDYWVMYKIVRAEQMLVIHLIGHRSKVYRR